MAIFINQTNAQSYGSLQIFVTRELDNAPIQNAKVDIYPFVSKNYKIYELTTDHYGRTPIIELPAPPKEYSDRPSINLPYSRYNIIVSSPGYMMVEIIGTQIYPGIGSYQPVSMPIGNHRLEKRTIVIGPNPLDL